MSADVGLSGKEMDWKLGHSRRPILNTMTGFHHAAPFDAAVHHILFTRFSNHVQLRNNERARVIALDASTC